MDNLTFRNKDGQALLVRHPYNDPLVLDEALERLCQYEESGLTPEDFKNTMDEYMEFKKAQFEQRLVLLPYKVGDTLYHVDFFSNKAPEIKAIYIDTITTAMQITLSSTKYFMTRIEAERWMRERIKYDS